MDPLFKNLGLEIDFFSEFICWGLIFTRTLVVCQMAPFLAAQGVPGRVRLILSMVLSTYAYFLMRERMLTQLPDEKALIFAFFFKEIFFGLAIGMTTVMTFYAIDAGGRIVDNQRGSANAQLFVPQMGQVSIFGLFNFWLAMIVFIGIAGHTAFIKAYINSFVRVPVLELPQMAAGISPFMQHLISMSGEVLVMGMQLAAPVLIAIFLTDIVLGIANKMAPQIPVFELGFILKGYVGVFMVWVLIAVIMRIFSKFFLQMQENVQQMIMLFSR